MGGLSPELAAGLRDRLSLTRGVETGTLHGGGARLMAEIFEQAVSIELSEELHRAAGEALADVPNLRLLHGDSRAVLPGIAGPAVPTLYFLDGHWSGIPESAGEEDECPVIDELRAIAAGHPDDCVVIDDARLFVAAPPPPHDPAAWPTLLEVLDAVRAAHPEHHVTVAHDQVVGVPARAKDVVDAWVHQAEAPAAPATGPRWLPKALAGRLSR